MGIFIAERESLAVFEWRYGRPDEPRLLAFGDDSALLRLRGWLRQGAVLELRHLKVDAIRVVRWLERWHNSLQDAFRLEGIGTLSLGGG